MNILFDRRLGHGALFIWALATIYSQWNTWSLDASALYFSAYFYDLGQWGLVYSPEPTFFWEENYPGEWLALAKSQGEITGNMSPFVYPPIWAALLAPLASGLSAIQFFNLINVLNAVATVAAVYMSYGLLRPQKISFTVWSLVTIALIYFSVIGVLAIELGQPQVFVTFLILAAFRALLASRDTLAGTLLALAAAIKIAPGFLVVVFIMERRWHALWVFVAAGAAFAGLSLLVAGPDLHRELLLRLQDLEGKVLVSRVNLTLDSALMQISNWLNNAPGWGFFQYWIQDKTGWISWISKLVLIVGLGAAYFATRQQPAGQRIWFRLQLVFLIVLITGPLAWTHYLFLTILLLPGLLVVASQRFATLFLLGFLIIFSIKGYWLLFPLSYGGNIQLFTGFGTVVALIFALILLARRQSP